jgi:hypothetical protein
MSVFGPLWAGTAYDHIAPMASFWLGAVLFMFAGFLLTRVKVKSHVNSNIDAHSMAD